ncbi:hypothetical protein AMAG_04330 [Allomyces macrogynus ATCC 38327]|uniref:CN hydrolase domain-containing protein n=1 Tax=Allomyces macrogynus (strain ATCC 38327) TaxID=578462 RepID=A0A0L0S846_ALLM3|nr:hypothetical protein AMAG_04330 [Allomyces macrogynus ATCC 38327]|eukprot:KNE58778.1 hypothetical protein AMAG_04330 [Allomyces macrogynus ATCC 38327]
MSGSASSLWPWRRMRPSWMPALVMDHLVPCALLTLMAATGPGTDGPAWDGSTLLLVPVLMAYVRGQWHLGTKRNLEPTGCRASLAHAAGLVHDPFASLLEYDPADVTCGQHYAYHRLARTFAAWAAVGLGSVLAYYSVVPTRIDPTTTSLSVILAHYIMLAVLVPLPWILGGAVESWLSPTSWWSRTLTWPAATAIASWCTAAESPFGTWGALMDGVQVSGLVATVIHWVGIHGATLLWAWFMSAWVDAWCDPPAIPVLVRRPDPEAPAAAVWSPPAARPRSLVDLADPPSLPPSPVAAYPFASSAAGAATRASVYSVNRDFEGVITAPRAVPVLASPSPPPPRKGSVRGMIEASLALLVILAFAHYRMAVQWDHTWHEHGRRVVDVACVGTHAPTIDAEVVWNVTRRLARQEADDEDGVPVPRIVQWAPRAVDCATDRERDALLATAREVARESGVYVGVTWWTNATMTSSWQLVDPDGHIVGEYGWKEEIGRRPAESMPDGPPVVDLDGGKVAVGMAIGEDVDFASWAHRRAGAMDMLLVADHADSVLDLPRGHHVDQVAAAGGFVAVRCPRVGGTALVASPLGARVFEEVLETGVLEHPAHTPWIRVPVAHIPGMQAAYPDAILWLAVGALVWLFLTAIAPAARDVAHRTDVTWSWPTVWQHRSRSRDLAADGEADAAERAPLLRDTPAADYADPATMARANDDNLDPRPLAQRRSGSPAVSTTGTGGAPAPPHPAAPWDPGVCGNARYPWSRASSPSPMDPNDEAEEAEVRATTPVVAAAGAVIRRAASVPPPPRPASVVYVASDWDAVRAMTVPTPPALRALSPPPSPSLRPVPPGAGAPLRRSRSSVGSAGGARNRPLSGISSTSSAGAPRGRPLSAISSTSSFASTVRRHARAESTSSTGSGRHRYLAAAAAAGAADAPSSWRHAMGGVMGGGGGDAGVDTVTPGMPGAGPAVGS